MTGKSYFGAPATCTQGGALHAPATQRNREPIAGVLAEVLPAEGLVLELASGSGEHAAFFARRFPHLAWQPSDPDPDLRASIAAHAASAEVDNLRPPLDLDAIRRPWPIEQAEAVLCINMIHIAPWAAAEGLAAGAGEILAPGAPLILYGPYKRGGVHTAPSNASFDQSLRSRDPSWGVRDLEAVEELCKAAGFVLERIAEMPANNLTLVFRKGG